MISIKDKPFTKNKHQSISLDRKNQNSKEGRFQLNSQNQEIEVDNNVRESFCGKKLISKSYFIHQSEEQNCLQNKTKSQVTKSINKKEVDQSNNYKESYQNIQKLQKKLNKTRHQSSKDKQLPKQSVDRTVSHQICKPNIQVVNNQRQLQELYLLMKDYRSELIKYQVINNKKQQESKNQNQLLKRNVDDLIKKLDNSKTYQIQQERYIILLVQQNSELKAQLSKYISRASRENQVNRLKTKNIPIKTKLQLNSLSKNHLKQSSNFSEDVREQLQNMIQSLIVQVQYLRNVTQKLKQQIKAFNKELTESQKIIMKKNERVYELQMSLISSQKQIMIRQRWIKMSGLRDKMLINSQIFNNSDYNEDKEINFTLADVIQKKIQITNNQKLIIATKIIECYEEKIAQQNYEMFMAEDLIISILKQDLETIKVRPYPTKSGQVSFKLSHQKNSNLVDNIIWNMNFMLEELFKKYNRESKLNSPLELIQNSIRDKISKIFNDEDGKKVIYIEQLKQILKSSICMGDK